MPEQIVSPSETIIGRRDVVPATGLSDFFASALGAAAGGIAADGGTITGPPTAVYRGQPGGSFDVLAGFPAMMPGEAQPEGLEAVALPAGAALSHVHEGSYDTLASTYELLTAEFTARGARMPDLMWEKYLVGPDSGADPAEWQTQVVFPLPAEG
jgi:hypothetical protein